jgi:hypothetical protein
MMIVDTTVGAITSGEHELPMPTGLTLSCRENGWVSLI